MLDTGRAMPAAGSAALAQALRTDRTRIAAAMLEGAIRRHEITVGAELLAFSFVDALAGALETQNWPGLLAWVDRTCEKHGGAAPVARLLTQAIATVAAALAPTQTERERLAAQLEPVAAEIHRIAIRPRVLRVVAANESLDEIDVALDELISRLTDFDPATADHSRAVAMWCARVARKLGLSTAETTFVRRAGLIHDIGKVTTPAEILNAPYRLSEREMTIMREHAAAGAEIVSRLPLVAHLTPAVRSHHERVDGTGYPDGRAGADIPLAVRIVSVADSFNAMIGNRPYRLPMPPTVALEQLRIHRDTQFDSNVVAAMIEVVDPQR